MTDTQLRTVETTDFGSVDVDFQAVFKASWAFLTAAQIDTPWFSWVLDATMGGRHPVEYLMDMSFMTGVYFGIIWLFRRNRRGKDWQQPGYINRLWKYALKTAIY